MFCIFCHNIKKAYNGFLSRCIRNIMKYNWTLTGFLKSSRWSKLGSIELLVVTWVKFVLGDDTWIFRRHRVRDVVRTGQFYTGRRPIQNPFCSGFFFVDVYLVGKKAVKPVTLYYHLSLSWMWYIYSRSGFVFIKLKIAYD